MLNYQKLLAGSGKGTCEAAGLAQLIRLEPELTPEPKYRPPSGEKLPDREVVGFTTKTPAECRS